MKKVIIFLFVIYSFSISTKFLFDEKHCCEVGVWNNLLDTLVSYGTLVFNTLDVGLEFVENVDNLWIENPGCSLGGYLDPYTDWEKHLIVSFNKRGGNVLIGLSGNSEMTYIANELLSYVEWEPSVIFRRPSTLIEEIFVNYISFKPFSYKGQRVTFEYPWDIVCGQNCYPIFMDSLGNVFATISFPFPNDTNCGYIIAVTGNHFWEDWESCIENAETTDTYTFAKNILLCMADVPGHILNKGSLPEPYQIEITPTSICANPGDTIRIHGRNLWRGFNESLGGDIEIYIGATERVPHDYDTIIIPIRYAQDSTWLEFVVPDLPLGIYPIRLGHKAITFYGGEIVIPDCPCPHRCERFPNPITPNFDAINDFAQFEFDGIFVKPARIHIFDIHGHEIRTIDVPAGLSAKQHARWDGTDDGGNPVPEGVYIYTIEVTGEIVCEGTVTVAR